MSLLFNSHKHFKALNWKPFLKGATKRTLFGDPFKTTGRSCAEALQPNLSRWNGRWAGSGLGAQVPAGPKNVEPFHVSLCVGLLHLATTDRPFKVLWVRCGGLSGIAVDQNPPVRSRGSWNTSDFCLLPSQSGAWTNVIVLESQLIAIVMLWVSNKGRIQAGVLTSCA